MQGSGGGWQSRVRVNFDQPAKKLHRRKMRQAKAAKIAPRPVSGLLRPVVRCPTQRYNIKVRAGRGFTFDELKEAGINKMVARSIGIAVDHRRRNRSVESLQTNVDRLKEYMSRLVVFPRKAGKLKKGDSTPEVTAAVDQHKGPLVPIKQPVKEQQYVDITEDMRKKSAVQELFLAKALKKAEGKKRWKKEEDNE